MTMVFSLSTNISNATSPDRRIGGWTESVYDNLVSFDATAITNFLKLCQLRAALLPTGARIKGQRYELIDPPGQATTRSVNFPGPAGVPCDVPQMALLVSCPGKNVINVRNYEIRGIPDGQVVEGEYAKVAPFPTKLRAFLNFLSNFNFRGLDLSQTAYPLVKIAADGTYTTTIPNTLAAGQMVKVLRTLDSTGKKRGGVFQVTGLEGPPRLALLDWPYGATTKGKIRVNGIVYPEFNGPLATPNQVVVRKVGKVSGQYRGRRSAKRA